MVTHDTAFDHVQYHGIQSTKLANHKPSHRFLLFTASSDSRRASLVTQKVNCQTDFNFNDQLNEHIYFLSGSLTGARHNWTILENEAFQEVVSFSTLDHFTQVEEVSLYAFPAKLVSKIDPHSRNSDITNNTPNKVMRWGLKLSDYPYSI